MKVLYSSSSGITEDVPLVHRKYTTETEGWCRPAGQDELVKVVKNVCEKGGFMNAGRKLIQPILSV